MYPLTVTLGFSSQDSVVLPHLSQLVVQVVVLGGGAKSQADMVPADIRQVGHAALQQLVGASHEVVAAHEVAWQEF
jgi:hypothetical protein